MSKESFTDKLAKKTFNSAGMQKCWQIHLQMFGPILEPAFTEDYTARVDLIAALNYISRRNVKQGMSKLDKIQKRCTTDADRTACSVFMGVCMEIAGQKDAMLEFYQEANVSNHAYYLPYMKVAQYAIPDREYETAIEYYKKSIVCLQEDTYLVNKEYYLGTVYSNLAYCYVKMKNLEEAEAMLQLSREILPQQEGREEIEKSLQEAKEEVSYVLQRKD